MKSFRCAALADTTKRTYKSQLNAYLKFCFNFGFQPVPASQETLCLYTAYLARTLSANSIPCYLNVIRLLHLESGYQNPIANNWELNSMKKGISRLLGQPAKQKHPITVAILIALRRSLDNHPIDLAFWSASLIAFLGFLRKPTLIPSPELMAKGKFIARGDVTRFTLGSFSLNIRHSKTNQFGQRVLCLPFVSCPDPQHCPVRALVAHLGKSSLSQARPLFNYVENGREVVF